MTYRVLVNENRFDAECHSCADDVRPKQGWLSIWKRSVVVLCEDCATEIMRFDHYRSILGPEVVIHGGGIEVGISTVERGRLDSVVHVSHN